MLRSNVDCPESAPITIEDKVAVYGPPLNTTRGTFCTLRGICAYSPHHDTYPAEFCSGHMRTFDKSRAQRVHVVVLNYGKSALYHVYHFVGKFHFLILSIDQMFRPSTYFSGLCYAAHLIHSPRRAERKYATYQHLMRLREDQANEFYHEMAGSSCSRDYRGFATPANATLWVRIAFNIDNIGK